MGELFNMGGDYVGWLVAVKVVFFVLFSAIAARQFYHTIRLVYMAGKGHVNEKRIRSNILMSALYVLGILFLYLGMFVFYGNPPVELNSMQEEPAGHIKMIEKAPDTATPEDLAKEAQEAKPDVLKRQEDPSPTQEIEEVMKEIEKITGEE